MIFKKFEADDIVAGRITKVASGFWPDRLTNWSASNFVDGFFQVTQSSATPNPAYGSSIYDIRKSMYYIDMYPNETYRQNNNPYFSVTYGHIAGSGSFDQETGSIRVTPTKAIYSQYKNLLLGITDEDGKFSFRTGSSTIDGDDIFVINFSSYEMKDRVDEGILEISLSGSNGVFTFRDDSVFQSQTSPVYNLITGSTSDGTSGVTPFYDGIGLFYPANGIVVFNAAKLDQLVGLSDMSPPAETNYFNGAATGSSYPTNPLAFSWSIRNSGQLMKVRRTENVPSRHYFVRVKNREFNYSNNPTYMYDGNDGVHQKGEIKNADFVEEPRTYITTIGMYNDANELVAVAKLSRPAVKSFTSEATLQIKLDF